MKTRILLILMLLLSALAFGQTTIPTCNSFDATSGAPVFTPAGGTPTTLCTDYFGKANYANSPLPVSSVDISATGFTILNGGSGYPSTTTATITDFYNTPGATGATATLTIDPLTGTITAITGTAPGSGYVAPVVNIIDPSGLGADAVILARLDATKVLAGTGIRKFVDALPALPIAGVTTGIPTDTTTFPNSDYYEIALVEYSQQMHSDLPPTRLRGYVQVPSGNAGCPTAASPQYLGPVILAQRDRPVRVKFTNCLPTGAAGNLQIPVDTTYMGAGLGPDMINSYTQNRATIHLHGGNTPWISDGTPNQWTVPAGENTVYKKGVSTQNVPDMFFVGGVVVPACSAAVTTNCQGGTLAQLPLGATNDPGDGSMTFYFTNQQGGRLMFYHDHAYGITRLNVYAGEAAGYLVADPAEETALAAATVPGTVTPAGADLAHLIPLVIQDKTFVPSPAQLAAEDPTWIWGTGTASGLNGNGDLWIPHVYPPNQNPADLGGSNAFGRWDYGAWFFPPMTTLSAAGTGPQGPHTAVTIPCTSAGFPGVVLQPTAANNFLEGCPITPNPSGTPEAFMDTPLVNGKAYPVLHVAPAAYRFRILNAANDRTLNLSLYQACGSGTFSVTATNCALPGATATEVPMVPAVRGGAGTTGYLYPDQLDGRDAGVPDSLAAGPPFLQIGTEGGLLPKVAVVPPAPVGFEYNRRSITVLNISNHALLLGAAERADAVVDFTAFAGKTLILYNDAPTPVPAFDSRIDYYTNDPDQVTTGGAPTTIPGYGPNTRTIMQIVVDAPAAPNVPAFSVASMQAALPAIFSASNATTPKQAIIPEPAYPLASGGNAATATYGRISDNTITYTPIGGTAPITINLEQKAIQELFTLDYGRMNATLGTELPLTNFLVQTTLPYGYAEWATEIIQDSKDPNVLPQIWKLTHNGVDTHFIHFHLFNVQVINRIGWDGAVKPPDTNELGWKDTVRMNPLEDIVVALQPVSQALPFPLPDSIRSLDVTMMDGMVSPAISGIDPATGNAIVGGAGTTNAKVNFGQEYVWHCHILGHEENDMMRPIIFQVAPPAPSAFTAVRDAAGQVLLTWTDNAANESGFNLQRDTDPAFPAPVDVIKNGNASLPNTAYNVPVTVTDSSAPAGTLYYRLQAEDDFMPQSPLTSPFQVLPMFSAWVSTQTGTASTTTITAPAITYGQNGVVTVTVTAAVGTIAGNVTLAVDGGTPISLPLSGGVAVFDTTNTPALLAPAVGNHALVANFAAQNGFAASSATGSLVVNQAPLTITASSSVVPFGVAIPAITSTIVGLVAPDTITSLGPLVCSTTATQGSPAGTYPTTCSGAVNANYAITYVNGTVTITNTSVTITASSQVVPYGSPVAGVTPTILGLVPPDTVASLGPLVCTTTATQASPVGTYPTSCSGAVNSNYTFTYVPGTVTITAVPLTITANNATRAFGAANPAFTATYAGFVNGNTPASLTGTLACTTTANATSPAGTYPITCSGQTSANYTITYVPGVLTVTALGPILTLAPTALTFTSPINVTSASQSVTVSNSGSAPLRISVISLGGANPGRFGLTHNCPIGGTGLAPGGSCTANVTFTPNSYTARSALLRVLVAAPAVSGSVTLTGTTLRPVATLSTTALDFGSQPINTTSAPQTVTLTNGGTVPLLITSISMGGPNAGRFPQTNNCPIGGAGLAPTASCTITVTFQPNRRAARSATLTIRDNAVNSPQTVALTGTGI
jgi:FtsP/CotA-like multicopper oxidase with cupredoxin domain